MEIAKYRPPARCPRRFFLYIVFLASLAVPVSGSAQFQGGFVENIATATARPRLTQAQIQGLLPVRGKFTFPAPYNTQAVRLTNASDCGGTDCVNYIGYSYWRNINNHVGSDTMLIFLGLNNARGGGGPTLFQYNKVTDALTNLGPLFSASAYSAATGEGWYFSASLPTKLYLNDGPKMLRYDVLSKQFDTVFDVSAQFGADKYIWQMHSSSDDRVHSATLRVTGTWEMLGCVVYREDTRRFFYYGKSGDFDECQIDKSGRWLVIKENIDGTAGEDNRIIDIETGVERVLLDQNGAAGHSDMGHGYMVAADNWDSQANASKLWKLATDPLKGSRVYHNLDWAVAAPNHVSHSNARPGVPPEQQYACGSSANRNNSLHANEIICFRLDTSLVALVVAPVMTDLNAAGGGSDDYSKLPKGNLDVTGQYFIWTSNTGGNRLDAFLVKVPAHLLNTAPDTIAPSVTISAPLAGSTVSSTVAVSVNAGDNVGIAGVQFRLDGTNLGAEVTTAPYSILWNTALAGGGTHTLTAVARDAAGNATTSTPVVVTTAGDASAPAISAVAVPIVTDSSATIAWTTNEPSDSQIEYGPTSAYGNTTPLNANLFTAHVEVLKALAPNTLYHFRVRSRNTAGFVATSGDFTFTTLALPDIVPPIIPVPVPTPVPTPVPSPQPIPGPIPANPFPELVGHWKLDEGSGTTANDTAGNGGTATLLNGPTWTTGKLGQALAFDGIDDAVQIAHTAAFNSYPLTVALWVKTPGASGLRGIVNKYLPSSFNGYQIFMNNGSLCAWYFIDTANYIWDGSGCTLSTPGVADNQWHHVALVVDAAGGRLYVDGLQKASQAWSGIPGAASTLQALSLGQYPGTAQPSFPGVLDDVRMYARALSAAEVTALSKPVSGRQNVVWTNLVNMTATDNSLQKTAGCDGCEDAGASSQQQLTTTGGYLEFTASEMDKLRFAGLSGADTGTNATEIAFALRFQAGVAEIRERGLYRSETSFAPGDIFRITVESGVVKYAKNGAVFYTSGVSPAYPLVADTAFFSLGGTLIDAVMAPNP